MNVVNGIRDTVWCSNWMRDEEFNVELMQLLINSKCKFGA